MRLFEKSSEDHWLNYFSEALKNFRAGNINSSYKHVFGTYGGIGNFNDIPLNFISDEEVSKVEDMRQVLCLCCKTNRT